MISIASFKQHGLEEHLSVISASNHAMLSENNQPVPSSCKCHLKSSTVSPANPTKYGAH